VRVRAWCRPRIDGFDHVPSVVPILDVPKAHVWGLFACVLSRFQDSRKRFATFI
jgi:hypothetical protein